MALEFKIQSPTGDIGQVDANYVVGQLQQAGFNPQGMSSDGLNVTLQDAQGSYEVPLQQAISNLGFKVMHTAPIDADYSNVQPGWRMAVNKLPDDDSRKAYIQGQMQRAGVADPKIVGSGRDWYVFNPQTSQYIGVTNSPDWDSSDLVEAGLEAPRAIASALGGGAGALAGGGVGSIPLAMLGAGAAGGGVDAVERGLIAAHDPVYRDVAKRNMSGMAKSVLGGAALDAGTMGLFKGAGPLAGKLLGSGAEEAVNGLMHASPISRTMQAAGATMEAGGGGLRGLANMADSSLGHDTAAMLIPGVSEAQTAGYLAQAPAYLTRGAVKGMDALGSSETLGKYAPELAGKLRGYAGRLAEGGVSQPTKREAVQGFAQRMSNHMGGTGAEEGAESTLRPSNILSNAFRDARLKGGKFVRSLTGDAEAASPTPSEAEGISLPDLSEKEAAARWAGFGRRLGQGAEHLERLGGSLQTGATAVGRGVVRGARATGAGLQTTGTALRAAGTFARPLESRALMRYGSEELYGKPELEDLYATRRRRPASGTMDEVLAQN